jgi:hypothetical protein
MTGEPNRIPLEIDHERWRKREVMEFLLLHNENLEASRFGCHG